MDGEFGFCLYTTFALLTSSLDDFFVSSLCLTSARWQVLLLLISIAWPPLAVVYHHCRKLVDLENIADVLHFDGLAY